MKAIPKLNGYSKLRSFSGLIQIICHQSNLQLLTIIGLNRFLIALSYQPWYLRQSCDNHIVSKEEQSDMSNELKTPKTLIYTKKIHDMVTPFINGLVLPCTAHNFTCHTNQFKLIDI